MKKVNHHLTQIKRYLLFFALLCAFVLNNQKLQAQTPLWGSALGGTRDDQCYAIATDAAGNVYSTGTFTPVSTDFDPGAGTLAIAGYGNTDVYIYKSDPNGNVVWAKGVGGAGADAGYSIAVDASGNVFVSGSFTGTADFDPSAATSNLVSAGGLDAFILKLDASGNFLWAKNIGSTGTDEARGLTTDASGNIYYTGYFNGTVDFDFGAGTTSLTASSSDPFVSKINSNGTFAWAVSATGLGNVDQGRGIRVDASGNVIVGGIYNSQMDMDPTAGVSNITPTGTGYFMFLWKLNSTGGLVWATSMGASSTSNSELRSIDIDATGNIYSAGYFSGTVDFDPGAGTANLGATASSNGFIQKVDASGTYQWAGQFSTNNVSGCFGVDVDAAGNVLVCGNHKGKTDLIIGADTFYVFDIGSGGNCAFYAKMTPTGSFITGGALNESYAGSSLQGGYSTAIAGSLNGSIVTGGIFQYLLDIDPTSVYNQISNPDPSYSHIFIVKIDSCFTPEFNLSPARVYGCSTVPVTATLSGSVVNNSYQLYKNGVAFGSPVAGTGNAMTFTISTFNDNDSLTIIATRGACSKVMPGKTYITSGTLDMESGLIRHYRLDNNYLDELGGASASSTAGVFVADRFGNATAAKNVAAANQGINVPTFSLDTSTIIFWMQPTYVAAGGDAMLLYANYTNANIYHLRMLNNTLVIGNGSVVGNSGAVLTANTWYQVIYAKQGPNVKVYLNGNLVINCTNAPLFSAQPVISLGTGQTSFLSGPMDDIRFYNYAFTDAQATLAAGVPNILVPVRNVTACLGSPITIRDSIQGGSGFTYQWKQNSLGLSGATATSYTIPSLSFADTGSYRMQVSKGCLNTVSQSTTVGVAASQITVSNLAAWYKFDNNAADNSGNSNHGTNNGATATSNRFGVANAAYDFNSAANNTVTVPSTLIGNGQRKSVSMWFKHRAQSTPGPLLTYQIASPGAWNSIAYIGTDNILRGWLYQGGTSPWSSGITIDTNWHHLVVSVSTNRQTIYLDGVSVATLTGTPNPGTSNILRIGGGYVGAMAGVPTTGTYYFNGKIDEVRFYGDSLTTSDVNQLYTKEMGFTSQPVSQTVCPAATVTFTVTALGSVSYQWQKNGINISGANTASYTRANVQYADTGNYTCIITNGCSGQTLTSNVATLGIGVGLTITSQPQASAVCAGANATFTFAVSSGSYTYQWRRNGIALSNGTKYAGVTTTTLSVSSVAAADTGSYDCVITTSCGNTNTNTASLSLLSPPAITSQPVSVSYCGTGGTVNLSVGATGAGLTYQWQLNTNNLSNGFQYSGVTTATLGVVVSSGVQNYRVIVSGTCGTPVTSAYASVTSVITPSVITPPASTSVCSGATVLMTVQAAGGGLSYQWKKGTAILSGATDDTLTLSNVGVSDAGQYQVIVSNLCGNYTSAPGTLTVTQTTAITTEPQPLTLCTGDTIRLSLVAAGTGLTYRWYLGAGQLSANGPNYSNSPAVPALSGQYRAIVTGSCGADTSQTVTVTVNPASTITTDPVSQSACTGSSVTFTTAATGTNIAYQWRKNGVNIPSASTSSYTIATVTGADAGSYDVLVGGSCGTDTSAVASLTIVSSASISQQPVSAVACAGGTITLSVTGTGGNNTTYQWKRGTTNVGTGATLTLTNVTTANAGSYTVVVAGSCGSITSNAATVTINSPSAGTISRTICAGSSYAFNGVTLVQSGVYKDTLQNATGCDSILTLNLTVSSPLQGAISRTICAGSSYSFNSMTLTQSGAYRDTLQNANGCDSILTLNLTVSSPLQGSIARTICAGTSYTFNGMTLTQSGAYRDTLQNANGCDSILTLNLIVSAPLQGSIARTICAGTSYTFNGITLTQSGAYRDTLQNANGCDSILTLNLTVSPVLQGSITRTVCAGGSYAFNGMTLTQSGTYRDTLQNATGCDSILILSLTVLPQLSSQQSTVICNGSSVTFNGQTITAAGQYRDTLSSAQGCDSIIILSVAVAQPTAATITLSACGSFTFAGQSITTSGTYSDTITNVAGCDSVITLQLTIHQASASTIHDTICYDASYTFGSQTLTSTGSYSRTIPNSEGCDSVIALELYVRQPLNISISQSGNLLSATLGFSSYQWLLSGSTISGASASDYTATQNGDYSVQVSDSYGCHATSAAVTVTGVGIHDMASKMNVLLAPNPTSQFLTITLEDNHQAGPVSVEITDLQGKVHHTTTMATQITIDVSGLASGIYTLRLHAVDGIMTKRFTKL